MRPLSKVIDERGIYLGRGQHGDVFSGRELSTLVLGPTRSGKTSALIIPNLLTTQRAAIITSTKDDVVQRTAGQRRDVTTLLFDPSDTVIAPRGVERVGYSPLQHARTWDGAVLATRSLLDVARRGGPDRAEDHWTERAGALVAPLLHAAALAGESLPQLATRIDERQAGAHLGLLREAYGDAHPATALLGGILSTEERERSGIWSTASGLFAGLRTEGARRAAQIGALDVSEFLSGRHQLHIVAPSRHQALSVPLVVGLIEHVVHTTYERHHDGARLLLALDEMANVAPLPQLPSLVSEGGGQGVLTLACLQDLSQARVRWGAAADGFLSLFPTTIALPGLADRRTLELLSHLAGRVQVPVESRQRGAWHQPRSSSTSWIERDRASLAQLAQGRPGHALTVRADKSLGWVELTPAHRDPRFLGYRSRSDRESSRTRER